MLRSLSDACSQVAEYRLSPAAERDLEEIWRHTRRHWSVEQADRYIDIFVAAFVTLAEAPTQGSGCEDIRPGYRRHRVVRHMVYFQTTGNGVAIVRILHDRMDALRHL